jgi:hypothetical protein
MKPIWELIIEDSLDNNGELNLDLLTQKTSRYNSILTKRALAFKRYAEMKPIFKVGDING